VVFQPGRESGDYRRSSGEVGPTGNETAAVEANATVDANATANMDANATMNADMNATTNNAM